ncbi:unnamed protein product [Protopolystoma xenopodis]|uniref:Uncharacterized protein n=1 Tax=Protopolystoma xenopodis TaxID=117903 RepID=A0A448XGC5_9PLAT|nr:unnamed protein product [Protopolystoma xenopodis]
MLSSSDRSSCARLALTHLVPPGLGVWLSVFTCRNGFYRILSRLSFRRVL